jgi:hypothetical protein
VIGDSATVSLVALASMGAFHGINPGMGWLFAVALGMQERRRGAVLRALVPLGAGHALAVAGAVLAAAAMGGVVPMPALRWVIAGILITLGVVRLFRHGHPRWVGMRVGAGRLTLWSFLMATAHGAGLMVVPVFVGMSLAGEGHDAHHAASASTTASAALVATGVHALSYLAVTAFVAVLVFERLGVGMLRRAWFNLDLVWAIALAASGIATFMM